MVRTIRFTTTSINLKDYYKINTEEFINKIPDNIPDQWKEYLKNLLYK